jgi:hypothetical protein
VDIGQVWYLERGDMEDTKGDTMAIHREARGQYLIEAGAFHLPGGNKWQPRLTMTRLHCTSGLPKSQAFPGLTPLFDTAKGATRFAADLGRNMADQGSARLTI